MSKPVKKVSSSDSYSFGPRLFLCQVVYLPILPAFFPHTRSTYLKSSSRFLPHLSLYINLTTLALAHLYQHLLLRHYHLIMSAEEFKNKFTNLTKTQSIDEQALTFLKAFVAEFQGNVSCCFVDRGTSLQSSPFRRSVYIRFMILVSSSGHTNQPLDRFIFNHFLVRCQLTRSSISFLSLFVPLYFLHVVRRGFETCGRVLRFL